MFRKPDENGPLSSSESGFLKLFDLLSRILLFCSKAALVNSAKNLFEGRHYKNDVLQNQSICLYSKTDSGIERELSSFLHQA